MGVEISFKAKGITFTENGARRCASSSPRRAPTSQVAGLRVGVKGGGCSGFQYQLAFDERRDDDIVFEDHGLQLLVDPQSLSYVDGSQIDYVDSLTGAGFKVVNPNVVAACGCGSSFRVKDEEEDAVSAL